MHAYLRRRGWESDYDGEWNGWLYSPAFSCTPLPLQDYAYEVLVPDAPAVELDSTSEPQHIDDPYDFLWTRSAGVLPGGCPDHAVVERELSLHLDWSEPGRYNLDDLRERGVMSTASAVTGVARW